MLHYFEAYLEKYLAGIEIEACTCDEELGIETCDYNHLEDFVSIKDIVAELYDILEKHKLCIDLC